jgi:hypothetical protein
MYRSLPGLWEGWTKNLALLFPQTLRLATWRGIEFLAAFCGIAAAATGLYLHQPIVSTAGLLIAVPT